MRNIILLLAVLGTFIGSLVTEPITDTIDAISGATNETYSATIDGVAGASEYDDDEHDDEHDDDEHEEEDDD
jgi:hypothetical protein